MLKKSKNAQKLKFHQIAFNVFLSVNEGVEMLLRDQKLCLKHPMTIVDTFREKYLEVKYESSEILQKTLFFKKITGFGVTRILDAELTPWSF